MIIEDKQLIEYYTKHGDKETIEVLYKWFEDQLANSYSLNFNNLSLAKKNLYNKNQEVYSIFQNVQKIYFITLEHQSAKKIWSIEDVLNYSILIKVGMNKMGSIETLHQ